MSKLNNSQIPDTLSSKTIDNTNSIDTTTTNLSISGGSNGQVLSTDGSGNLSWATAGGGGLGAPVAVITKTADETVTSSTTMQDDDELYWNGFTSGKSYWVSIELLAMRTDTAANQSLALAFAGNSDGYARTPNSITPNIASGTGLGGLPVQLAGVNANIPTPGVLWVVLKASANFTGKLRFAQGLTNTTGVTVMKGSRMTIWEIA